MKVTAIMPTANRGRFIPRAIHCFLQQDFTDSELLIVDDGEEEISVPEHSRIRYVKLHGAKLSTGAKRNICCEMAQGEIVVHWDDDDWSAPTRISEQVARLESSGKKVTGYHSVLFWDFIESKPYKYIAKDSYTLGSSQCYYRSWWKSHPFMDKQIGEDSIFGTAAAKAGQLLSVDGGQVLVCAAHEKNTSIKVLNTSQCPPVSLAEFPTEFMRSIGR